MPDNVCWVGWFGVRPRFRREGFGTNAMYALFDVAQNIGSQELRVYTGSSDDVAVSFCKSLGFEVLGSAAEWAPSRTMDDSDIVLRRML
jgi:ribosomal protein S18 acetylase RimI-like enzyme